MRCTLKTISDHSYVMGLVVYSCPKTYFKGITLISHLKSKDFK